MSAPLFQEPKSLDQFKELINGDKLVVVDFHATWCAPCKAIAPTFKNYAEEYTGAIFAKIDVDEVPDVAGEYTVRAMPTFMFFKKGEKVDEVVGANPHNLKTKIERHL